MYGLNLHMYSVNLTIVFLLGVRLDAWKMVMLMSRGWPKGFFRG